MQYPKLQFITGICGLSTPQKHPYGINQGNDKTVRMSKWVEQTSYENEISVTERKKTPPEELHMLMDPSLDILMSENRGRDVASGIAGGAPPLASENQHTSVDMVILVAKSILSSFPDADCCAKILISFLTLRSVSNQWGEKTAACLLRRFIRQPFLLKNIILSSAMAIGAGAKPMVNVLIDFFFPYPLTDSLFNLFVFLSDDLTQTHKHTHTHTYIYIYIYIRMHICVLVHFFCF